MPQPESMSNSDDSNAIIKPVSAAMISDEQQDSVFYVINPKSRTEKITALPQNARMLTDNTNNIDRKAREQAKIRSQNNNRDVTRKNEENKKNKKEVHMLPASVQTRQIKRIDVDEKNAEGLAKRSDSRKAAQVSTNRRIETAAEAAESESNKTENRIHPIKKLKGRFRKNGLGAVDSTFNAWFFYCLWRFENSKKRRNGGNSRYLTYMKFMTAFAKIYGAFAKLLMVFAPLIAAFKPKADSERVRGKWLKHTFGTLMPLGVMAFTAVVIINISGYSPELELWIDDERIGIVASREVATSAMRTVELNVSGIVGEPHMFSGAISYRVVLMREPVYLTEREVRQALQGRSQNYIMRAYGLYIDGELVGATTDGSYIDETLNQILEEIAYRVSDEIELEDVEFANDIAIKRREYARRDVLSGEEFVNIVTYTTVSATMDMITETIENSSEDNANVAYASDDVGIDIYVSADTVSDTDEDTEIYYQTDSNVNENEADRNITAVAAAVNISRDAVTALPRGGINALAEINDNSVLAQVARSSASVAGVQVITTHLETITEEIPFVTQRIESNDHFIGTEIVRTAGTNGFRVITSEISSIGDTEVSREVINVEVVTAPEARVLVIGTRPIPPPPPLTTQAPPPPIAVAASAAPTSVSPQPAVAAAPQQASSSGFIRPVRGRISQYFSGSHRGIDIPAPFGTPILAAASGTVISAGWGGSFGNYVQISHANGYATLYAHMSSIGVSVGDRVSQGQEIGRVGSTGRSTGNHLHFEVTRNGVLVNPLNYIPR